MFVFPGLRVEQIRRLTRKLFYPALEVRLPKCQDLRKMASELSDMMAAMSYNMYTLVAEGWGGILALEVAAKLEALGKIVRVILIDAGPSDIKRWASELMRNPLPLISRYIRTPYKVKSTLICRFRNRFVVKNISVGLSKIDQRRFHSYSKCFQSIRTIIKEDRLGAISSIRYQVLLYSLKCELCIQGWLCSSFIEGMNFNFTLFNDKRFLVNVQWDLRESPVQKP